MIIFVSKDLMNLMEGIVFYESIQKADKEFLKNAQEDDKERYTIFRDMVMNITNGDYFAYPLMKFVLQAPTPTTDRMRESIITVLENMYEYWKTYDDKIFPIAGVSKKTLYDKQFSFFDDIFVKRYNLIKKYSKLPSLAKRNLAQEVRKERTDNEISATSDILDDILSKITDDQVEDNKEKIFNRQINSFDKLLKTLNSVVEQDIEKYEYLTFEEKVNSLESDNHIRVLQFDNNVFACTVYSYIAMRVLGCESNWCFSQRIGGNVYWEKYRSEATYIRLLEDEQEYVITYDGEIYNQFNDKINPDDAVELLQDMGVDTFIIDNIDI